MMTIVTHSEMECFIRAYLDIYKKLSSNLSDYNKHFLLPRYLTEKCEITVTISKAKGTSIRFNVNQKKEVFTFQNTTQSIEDEVLPKLSQKNGVFFVLDGERQVLENINLITREYFDRNKELIEKLTRSTNFVMDNAEKFIDVVSGDLKLVDCTLAFCENGSDKLDRIDCLWLFGSNRSFDFSPKKAEQLAAWEYQKLASALVNRIPIQTLIGLLSEFKKLIDNKNTTEPQMQTFFKDHWIFLDIQARRVFSKFDMGGDYIPDFIIETSDYRYVLVEIESPNAKLYTKKPLRQAVKLREADTQIKDYVSYAFNHINFLRNKLPFISAEKIKGLVIIGKSKTLTSEQALKLDKDRASTKFYDIITYDELFEGLRVFLENLGFRYSQK
jgi:hypothetical protein